MKTFDLKTTEGDVFAFEVSNTGLGRRGALRVVASIRGCRIVRRPKAFSWLREDVFCEFDLSGTRFEIWEPYGDNSRYWIGPQSLGEEPLPVTAGILTVRQAFKDAGPLSLFRRST